MSLSRRVLVFIQDTESLNNDKSIPEKVLLAAIIWRAYWDLFPAVGVEHQDKISAIKWFKGFIETEKGFSYKEIVDTLELSASRQQIINEAVFRAENNLIQYVPSQKTGPKRKNRTQYSSTYSLSTI